MKEILSELNRQKTNLQVEVARLKREISELPKGHLRISNTGDREQFFHIEQKGDTKGRYLSARKESELIHLLAQRDYDKAVLLQLEKRLKYLEKNISLYQTFHLSNIYSNLHPSRRKLIIPNVYDDVTYAKVWENEKYEGKSFDPNLPELYSEKGERVRSKSEKMIADKLQNMGIPYRYECPLKLKGFGVIFPDFTILDVHTNKIMYWEHMGRMDDPQYANKAIKKIQLYEKNDIYNGKNLIVTFETSQAPIDMRDVEKMLKRIMS